MRKILFLDFDGVLNNNNFFIKRKDSSFKDIDFENVVNLKKLMEKVPELEIVISSTWRIGTPIEELRIILSEFGIIKERIIGVTPQIHLSRIRGFEIEKWLYDNIEKEAKIAILDDDRDMAHLIKYLFQTDSTIGLSINRAQGLIWWFDDHSLEGIWKNRFRENKMKNKLSFEEQNYHKGMKVWLGEMAARTLEYKQSIETGRIIYKNNKIQLKIHLMNVRAGLRSWNKWRLEKGI